MIRTEEQAEKSKRTSLRQAQGKLNIQRSTLNVECGSASRADFYWIPARRPG